MSESKEKNSSLNQKLIADFGDVVWYLNMHSTKENNGESYIFFDEIRQGKVIHIDGATNCDTCIQIKDLDGQRFSAVQEIFFTDFSLCLWAFMAVKGKFFGKNNKNWYQEYLGAIRPYIFYKYKLLIPYVIGEKVKVSYLKEKHMGNIENAIFYFADDRLLYPWANCVELQVLIPESNVIVSVRKNDYSLVEINKQ